MRWAWVVALAAAVSAPVLSAPRPPGFSPAEQYFASALNLRDRIAAQILLIAAGDQNIVPTDRLQPNTFDGTQAFQAGAGLTPTGILDPNTIGRLTSATTPLFQLWGFAEVAHPWRGHPIWMPQGMDLRPIPNGNGLTFRDPSERVEVHYDYLPGKYVDKEYYDTLASLRAKGVQVHFSAFKDDWFVISSTSPQGFDAYRRYHIDGTGLLGFTLFWNNARGNVNAERIATLMSASLGALMAGRPFVEPAYFFRAPPAQPPQSYTPPQAYNPPSTGCGPTPATALSTIGSGAKLRVTCVPNNDVLKVREQPTDQSRVVGTISPDGSEIEFLGDRDGPWLFVRYERSEGWVHGRFVEYEPRRGRKLDEGE